ncbi:hypothetical protein M0813_29912 [Anaeramoeba flamelloides]|uniref:Uncharacterized protein n=1 Tax=Anaeramoeba flamelloides TaxID=1746091 RepID=A0ABQ8XMB8_9EUKA|nr:hypothetical protein M0813_29912 [Anaeramoeba flamelloides]
MKQKKTNQIKNKKGNKCKICGVYTEKIFLKVLVIALPFRFSILSPFEKGCGKIFLCKTCPNLITTLKNLEYHGSKITISIRYLPFEEMLRLIFLKNGQRFFTLRNQTQQKVTKIQNKNKKKIKIKNQNKMKKKKKKNKKKEKEKKKKINSNHNLPLTPNLLLNKLSFDFASIDYNTNSTNQHSKKVKSQQLLSVFKTKGLEKSIQKKTFNPEKNRSKRWTGMTLKTGRQPTHDCSQICQINDEQILSFTLVDNHLILNNNNNSSQSRQRSGSPTQGQTSNNSQKPQQQSQQQQSRQQNNTNQQQQQQQQPQQRQQSSTSRIQPIIDHTQPQSDLTDFEFQQDRTQELQEIRRRKQQQRREEQKRRLQDQKQKLLQQRQQLLSLSQEHESFFQNTTSMNKDNLKVSSNEKQTEKYSLELAKTDKKTNPPFIQTVSGIGLNKSNVGQIPNNFQQNNRAYPRGRQKASYRKPKRNSRMISYFRNSNETKKSMFQNNNEKQNQKDHSNLIQLKNNSLITNNPKLTNNHNYYYNSRNSNNQSNNRNNNLIKNSLTSGYQSWLKDKISKNSNQLKNDYSKEKEDLKDYISNLNNTNPKIISINPNNHSLDNISNPNSRERYSFNNNRNNYSNIPIDDNKQLFFDQQYNNNEQNKDNSNPNYSLYNKRLNDFENKFDKVVVEEEEEEEEEEEVTTMTAEEEFQSHDENEESRFGENEKNKKYYDPKNEITFLKLLLQKKCKDEKNQKKKFQNFISLPFGLNEIDIDFQEKDQNIQKKEEGLFSKMKIPDSDEIIEKIMDNTNDLTDFIKDFEKKKQLKFLELLDEFESNKINFEKNISNILYRFNQKKYQIDKIILKSIGDSLTEKKTITKNIYHNFDYDDQERENFTILQPYFLEWFQKIDCFDLENSLKKIDSALRAKMKLNIEEEEEKKKRKNKQLAKDRITMINKNIQNDDKNLSSESSSVEMANKNENLTSKILIFDTKKENMEIIKTEKNENLSNFNENGNENENENTGNNNYSDLIQKNNSLKQGEANYKPKERKAIIDFFIYQIMGQFEYEIYPKPPLNYSNEKQKITINKNIVNGSNSNSRSNDISGGGGSGSGSGRDSINRSSGSSGSINSGSDTKKLQNNLLNTTNFSKYKNEGIENSEYQDIKEQKKIIQAQLQKLIQQQEKNGFNIQGSPKTINNNNDFQKKQVINKQIISIKPASQQPTNNNLNRNSNLLNDNNNNKNNSNIGSCDLNIYYGSENVINLRQNSNIQINNQTFVKRKYDNYSKKYNKSDFYSNNSQQKFRNYGNQKYSKHRIHQSKINQRNNFSNTPPQKNLTFQRNQYLSFLPNNEKPNFDSNTSINQNISPFSNHPNSKQTKQFNDLINASTRKRVLTIKNDGNIFHDLIEPQKKIIKIQTKKNIVQHFPKKN